MPVFSSRLQQNVSSEAQHNATVAILPVVATNATCSVRVAAVTKGGVGPFSSPVEVFVPASGKEIPVSVGGGCCGSTQCMLSLTGGLHRSGQSSLLPSHFVSARCCPHWPGYVNAAPGNS